MPAGGWLGPELGKWFLLLKPRVCWGRRGREDHTKVAKYSPTYPTPTFLLTLEPNCNASA